LGSTITAQPLEYQYLEAPVQPVRLVAPLRGLLALVRELLLEKLVLVRVLLPLLAAKSARALAE
jgi:hypothetical protein